MSDTVNARSDGNKFSYWSRYLLVVPLLVLLACAEVRAEESGEARHTDNASPVESAPPQKLQSPPPLRIKKGDGYPVCHALLSSLMSIDPPRPLQNHMPLGRNPRGLSVPDWKPVNVQEHMDDIRLLFAERLKRYGQRLSESASQHEAEIKAMMEADLATGQVRMEHTDIDIDNDGYMDSVYRYYAPSRYTLPPYDWRPMGWLLLVNPGNPEADPERSMGGTFGTDFFGQPRYWDVYRYHGKTYVTQWGGEVFFMFKTSFTQGTAGPLRSDFCVITERGR